MTNTTDNKPVLIDKANDISAFASTDTKRPVITGIHANGNGTEATNGKIAIRVPYVAIDADAWPDKAGLATTRQNMILPVKPLKAAMAKIPKSVLPVLNTVRLATSAAGDKAHLDTNDLETSNTIATRFVEGDYPNLDAVWPTEEPTLSISLCATVLKPLVDYALKHAQKTGTKRDEQVIRFEFTDNLAAVRFSLTLEDGRVAKGVFMPCRMS